MNKKIILFGAITLTASLLLARPPKISVGQLEIVDKTNPNPISSVKKKKTAQFVRIGLREEADKVSISSKGSFTVEDLAGGTEVVFSSGKYMATAKDNKLFVGKEKFGFKVRIKASKGYLMETNSKKYRGHFIVYAKDNKVTLVNKLLSDDYFKGVLPREVVVSWPEETLRTQAVASRTYMTSHLGRHKKQGFDLCDKVHCQVYGGVNREHPRTNKAVDDTKGQILTYKGKPIGAFFHASCGGSTEQILPVWGSPNKVYLPQKKCRYGRKYPRMNWKITMGDQDIMSALKKKNRVKGKKLKSIKVLKKSKSGRAQTVQVKTDQGTFKMSGNAFRLALHPEKFGVRYGQTYPGQARGINLKDADGGMVLACANGVPKAKLKKVAVIKKS